MRSIKISIEDGNSIIEISNSTMNELLRSSVRLLVFAASITIFLGFFNAIFSIVAISFFSLGYLLIILIILKFVPFNSKMMINENNILVLIHSTKFMELEWNEITEVIVFTEKYQIASLRFRFRTSSEGYSLTFKGKDSSKTLRLWCLAFRFKDQKIILDVMRNMSETIGIIINEDNTSRMRIPLRD